MKRFVDLREAHTGYRFAWYDTVRDDFEKHSGNTAWDTFADFAHDYQGHQLERYAGLCPRWACEATDADR